MKKFKNFKLMLLGLLAMGSTTAFAQRNVGELFPEGNFIYEVTKVQGSLPGEVKVVAVRDGKNPVTAGSLELKGYLETTVFEDVYKFNVTTLGAGALQNTGKTTDGTTLTITGEFAGKATATTVVIPKQFKVIPSNAFEGFTNITSISFEEGSLVEDIQNNAFTTTQISKFDFSPCSKLAALNDEVFVEAGKMNSFVTEITLPENSTLLKDIQGAFKNLPNLTKITNLEKSSITQIITEAFANDVKLTSLTLPGTVKTIAAEAFKGSGIATLTIDVTSLQSIGDGVENVYGNGNLTYVGYTTKKNRETLTKLTLKGNLGGVVMTNAFLGCTNLATLDLSELSFISKGQFATSAFEGCTKIAAVSIKAINDTPAAGYTIDADAFKGCTKLASVTIGSINSAQAIGAKAFGNALKDVKIGTIKAGAESITTQAFVYKNVSGTTLNIAQGAGEFVSSDDATTVVIANNAFDFSGVTGAGISSMVYPTIKIGEIKSKGAAFGAGALRGNNIKAITFTGEIAPNGLNNMIIEDNSGAVTALTLNTLTFQGKIGAAGIATNAFANLPKVMTINFAGELVEGAIDAGAFELLKANSRVNYTCTTIADKTVNPFDKNAFDATTPATAATTRDIYITVSDAELKAYFQDAAVGLTTDGQFDIYRVDFYVAPVVITPDWTFVAYRNDNEKNVAWARYEFGSKALNSTVAAGSDLSIQRVQTGIDGGTIKVTLYGTYTDEDDFDKKSTIYMVPLKAQGGYYFIPGANTETIIAKVEKKNADFTVQDVKVKVTNTTGASSIWAGLTNTELHIAQNMMTNQQLIDGNAVDGSTPVDIFRGAAAGVEANIAEDLYIMTDPAKYNGFRVDKNEIKKGGAYINTGWYYMLLKKYSNGPTYAPYVVWMDDASESEITGILQVKNNVKANAVKDNAIYTLQGVRVNATEKGRIYIQNGKKFIAQ